MSFGLLVAFCLLALVAIGGAWMMIVSRHPVHSALYLVLNFAASAGLYLMMAAPFIAVVQIAVYAGAIMVLFLFIMMYLSPGMARDLSDSRGRRATTAGAVGLLALLLVAAGALRWSGEMAGISGPELAEARQAVERGQVSVSGAPAGTPEARRRLAMGRSSAVTREGTSVEQIGLELFGRYGLPFEVASLLLLVAMIGVLVIARPEMHREQARREDRPA